MAAIVEQQKSAESVELTSIVVPVPVSLSAAEARYLPSIEFKNNNAKRKLKRKLDVVILPLTTLLYLAAHLDRGNIGNVKLQGFQSDLMNGSDKQFSIALTCFYISYIIFNVPGSMLVKVLAPSTVMTVAALIWGIASTLQAAAFSFPAIVVCRLFIGIGEACFSPIVPFYYSIWYKREEIAKRNAFFIACGALADAFGGLISYGISFAKGSSIGVTWKILFLVEGIPTLVLALFIYFFLPDRPESTKYLSTGERELAMVRMKHDQPGNAHKKNFQ